MKPLLIGQAPGPQTRPEYPLFPSPRSSAGYRLMTMAELTRSQFVRGFDKQNLIQRFPGSDPNQKGDLFPMEEARAVAETLRPALVGRRVVLLGRKVAEAFGYVRTPFFEWYHDTYDFAVVPHPSGCSTAYNDPWARAQLRRVMHGALIPADSLP